MRSAVSAKLPASKPNVRGVVTGRDVAHSQRRVEVLDDAAHRRDERSGIGVCAQNDVRRGHVDQRDVHNAFIGGIEPLPFHRVHHAHDRPRLTGRIDAATVPEAAAHGSFAGKEPLGPRLVHDELTILRGVLVEQASALEAQADGGKIVG
jgi:hypothetical protein